MVEGIKIKVVDPDDDYLGIEIYASTERYSAATRIYAGLEELSEFAAFLSGFPKDSQDVRTYEFGSRDEKIAGGFCRLHFHSSDMIGHSAIGVEIEDDELFHEPAMAKMTIRTEAADIDSFILRLREIERDKTGEAILEMKV